ncbi:MAG: twin-arginine translocase TatA/TatE family subunit [Patescibacteria group bacterium]
MIDFIKNISPTELGIIILALIFFFGAKKITSLGKMGGETVREIKNIGKEFTKAVEMEEGDEPTKKEGKGVPK